MSYETSTPQMIASFITKPLLNGAATYIGCKFMGISGAMNSRYLGTRDAAQQLALFSAGSSVGTELIHNVVFPELGSSSIYSTASMLLSPVLQGAFLALAAVESHPVKAGNIGYNKIFLLGAGSEVAAAYTNDALITPYMRG